jgi:ATP-dependent RNA helicase SUPV3L1/SUV3
VLPEVTNEGGEEAAEQPEISAVDGDEPGLESAPAPDPSGHPPREGEGAAEAEATEEPKPILLWRPARFDRQGGHRRHDQRPRHGRGPAEAGAETGERAAHRQRQDGRPPFQGRREDGGADGAKPKFNRDRYKGPPKPQGEGGRPDFRKGKPQDGRKPEGRGPNGERGPKPAFQPRPPREERPAKLDPLSPFAKLAALRDQLQPKK